MPSFCGTCGSSLSGESGFCGSCGARVGGAPAGQVAVAAPGPIKQAGGGGSALKIVVIVVGVIFVLAALAIGGTYYAAHRYIRMAEDMTGIKAGDALHSIREAAAREGRSRPEAKRDGCLLLTKDEASAILGIEVIKVDGKPDERQSGEHCSFFVKPGSVEVNEERVKKSAEAIHGEAGANGDALPPAAIDMLKNTARGAVEAERNGEAPYFGFVVEREHGKIAFSVLGVSTRLAGGNPGGKAEEPLGVGDEATMGIGESLMCVVKGDVAITLDFTQVTGARSKGIALAKTILPRL